MKAFIPIEITDARLVSSTITEPDTAEPEWSPLTTYVEGNTVSVIDTDSHLVYEALANVTANLNKPPATSPTFWIEKSNTNKFRMFDRYKGTPSRAASPCTIVLRPGKRIDALMIRLSATTIEMTVTNGIDGPVAFTLDGYLQNRKAASFNEFFFSPFHYQKVVTTFSIPPVEDPVVTITLTDPSGFIDIEHLAIGQSVFLGAAQKNNPIVDSDNYSEITWDDFGYATLTPAQSIPTLDVEVACPKNRVDIVRQFKSDANAKAVVWSALDDFDHDYTESLVIYGVYRSFPINVDDPNFPVIKLSLKGI